MDYSYFITYTFIFLILLFFSFIFAFFYLKKNKNTIEKNNKLEIYNTIQELGIKIEPVSSDIIINPENKISPDNNGILGIISSAVNSGIHSGAAIAANDTYKVIIPAGEVLAKSKEGGYFRGVYHGKKGIKGVANLRPVSNSAQIISGVAAIAAFATGLYYMKSIDNKLSDISNKIKDITDYQESELHSKVEALINRIQKLLMFKNEILENPEVRAVQAIYIETISSDCMTLLGQTNKLIQEKCNKKKLKYDKYTKILNKITILVLYQDVLIKTLYNISDLQYILYYGKISREMCECNNEYYKEQTNSTRETLKEWNEKNVQSFKIDIDNAKRIRSTISEKIHINNGETIKNILNNKLPVNFNDLDKIKSLINMDKYECEDNIILQPKNVTLLIKPNGEIFLTDDENLT